MLLQGHGCRCVSELASRESSVCVCVCVSIMLLNTINTMKNPIRYSFWNIHPLQFVCVIKLVCPYVFVHII